MNDVQRQDHGGAAAILGDLHPDILDLSVNLNPYGPHPDLPAFLQTIPWREYPDPHTSKLRHALAFKRDWDPETIVFGNGANELIWAAVRALLHPGDSCVSIEPVYSEFARAAKSQGAILKPLLTSPENSFRTSFGDLTRHCRTEKARVLYLCNPQSPTGHLYCHEELAQWAAEHPDMTIILDESFLSLSEAHHEASRRYPSNVLRLVSMTKDFALAGLRLGYAHGELSLIQSIKASIPTWSVNALAQAAGLFCLEHDAFLEDARTLLLRDKSTFVCELQDRGLRPLPSQSIFLMLKVPHAQDLAESLWKDHHILVRSCASYGFPDWWRLAVRPCNERKRFLQALDKELAP